ncbi:MAG: SOS response-associated peptidase [Alphaproteobacteria bacterium]|nr:SOS response-associated peptidase [Alphaproteobacteria bacterium]
MISLASMCGRYAITTPIEAMREIFDAVGGPEFQPRYNHAPTLMAPVVKTVPIFDKGERTGHRRVIDLARWGLVPSWAKSVDIGNHTINARSDTVREKPSYRGAFRHHRCLVPADGFYEWTTATAEKGGGRKQPVWIAPDQLAGFAEPLFAFAGLFDIWHSLDGTELHSYTIVTTDASPSLANYHHRMPVILDRAGWETWMTGTPAEAAALMRPHDGPFRVHPVSTAVNNVRNDGPRLIEKVDNPDAPPPKPKPVQGSLF